MCFASVSAPHGSVVCFCLKPKQILSAILHLGNATHDNTTACDTVASLLALPNDELQAHLYTRSITVAGEKFHNSASVSEFLASRDGLAKSLYFGVFQWILDNVNRQNAAAVDTVHNAIGWCVCVCVSVCVCVCVCVCVWELV
jgi:myosin heavy subunit